MKKLILATICSFGMAAPIFGQEAKGYTFPEEADEHLLVMNAEARVDYERTWHGGHEDNANSGFIGKYIAIKAQGTILPGLSYTWRQRLSRVPSDGSFWSQTDVMNLSYNYKNWDFGAGKQVVAIGGYEYDRAPINLFSPNLFVNNVACYQFGVSAGYQIDSHNHLTAQISESVYSSSADRNLYGYNLMWNGSYQINDWLGYESIWSVNEMEYAHHKYANYIALGNKFTVNDNLGVIIDLMTRSYPDNKFMKNNTFMGEVFYNFTPKFRLTGKISYDCNRGVNTTSATEVARGTEYTIVGAVAEYCPVKSARQLLRVHASCFYGFGTNCDAADLMQKNTLYASVGLTWHMDFLKTGKPISK